MIRRLEDHVINQIAAGEVVDRPASVVRELVENSLDAGAKLVTVTMKGHQWIEVRDDGSGMSPEDALACLERHATSKIESADDLSAIRTLGFRGEALAAIAAVSKLRLVTRLANQNLGVALEVEGGKVLSNQPCGAPCGTTIQVRDIFFNTPARKHFLRSERSEEARVKAWFWQMALSWPQVAMRLVFGEKTVLDLQCRSSFLERARDLLRGPSVVLEGAIERVPHLEGLLSHPGVMETSGPSGAGLTIIVNNRPVQDKALFRAVKDGFGGALKDNESPSGCLKLTVPSHEVDVNVHPQKSEVRFRNSQQIFLFVKGAVIRSLREFKSPLSFQSVASQSQSSAVYVRDQVSRSFDFNYDRPAIPTGVQKIAPSATGDFPARTEGSQVLAVEKSIRFSQIQIKAQLLKLYLIGEFNGEVFLIDMHAAHERINYNRIREAMRGKAIPCQNLLLPIDVFLGEEELVRLEGLSESLQPCGLKFEVNPEKLPGIVRITALPAFLNAETAAILIRALGEEIPRHDAVFDTIQDKIAARIACHASVRAGDLLNAEECRALLRDLEDATMAGACPHGRPVAVALNRADLEAWFGRRE